MSTPSEWLNINTDDWRPVAARWNTESEAVRSRLGVDETTVSNAAKAFGKIGASTIGPAVQDVLQARADLGNRLGDRAAAVSRKITGNLESYDITEDENQRLLRG